MVAANKPAQTVELGAPPYMDNLVLPLNNNCPVTLISRAVEATTILDFIKLSRLYPSRKYFLSEDETGVSYVSLGLLFKASTMLLL